jgi:hypothetical protein
MSEERKQLEPKMRGQAFTMCPVCHCAVSPKRGIEMTFEVEGEKYTDLYHPKACRDTVEAMVADHTRRQYEEAKKEEENEDHESAPSA